MPAETLGRLTNDAGHNNVANDILAIEQFFTQGGPVVLDTMATPLDKLTEYEHLAYELSELASRRVPQAVTAEQARDELLRSLTLLLRACHTAERVMAFFELKNQAYRKVVPSLYADKSKGRRGAGEEEPEAEAELAFPVTTGIEGIVSEKQTPTPQRLRGYAAVVRLRRVRPRVDFGGFALTHYRPPTSLGRQTTDLRQGAGVTAHDAGSSSDDPWLHSGYDRFWQDGLGVHRGGRSAA